MTFEGWPVEALEFYEGLEADNSKTYWTTHKALYEDLVRRPMVELLAELEPEFGSGQIFRPYRDLRFSADKSPYKTAIGATLGSGYIQLSANGLAAGSGRYVMDRDELDRYREAVADDGSGAELVRIVARLERQDIAVQGHGSLKTAPRGYPADHPRIELLKHKGLIAWKEWPVEPWLGTRQAKNRVVRFLRTARPLNDWLSRFVQSSG